MTSTSATRRNPHKVHSIPEEVLEAADYMRQMRIQWKDLRVLAREEQKMRKRLAISASVLGGVAVPVGGLVSGVVGAVTMGAVAAVGAGVTALLAAGADSVGAAAYKSHRNFKRILKVIKLCETELSVAEKHEKHVWCKRTRTVDEEALNMIRKCYRKVMDACIDPSTSPANSESGECPGELKLDFRRLGYEEEEDRELEELESPSASSLTRASRVVRRVDL